MIRRPPRYTLVSLRRQRQMCIRDSPVGLSNELSCEAVFLPLPLQPPRVFSIRVFEALFPLGCVVCLAPQLFLLVYLHTKTWDCPVRQPPPCRDSSLPVSTPPTGLDECFFFNSLVVGLPYSSIFCQFWLFFDFKFVVVLLWVVQGGTVYLPMPPSWPEVYKPSFKSLDFTYESHGCDWFIDWLFEFESGAWA